MEAGLRPWAARLVALAVAMNVTFLINGTLVFKTLTRRRFLAQWAAYVTNSAIGNFCNYWTFVTLESTHRPVIGNPYLALFAGSAVAWAINYTGARLLVFGSAGKRSAARCRQRFAERSSRTSSRPSSSQPTRSRPSGPASAEPGSSRR